MNSDLEIIQKILKENGKIVDKGIFSRYFRNVKNINKKISRINSDGLILRIKRGTYYICDDKSDYLSISNYYISNIIGEKSFVSFEGALKFHGVFDQAIKQYISIAQNQYISKKLENFEYTYIKVLKDNYFGFKKCRVDGGSANIAYLERALLDMIEYKRNVYSISLVLEILQKYIGDIDKKLLFKYLKKYSQITVKIFGLLFDMLGYDSKDIHLLVNKGSTSRISSQSKNFSNKWRLYYDSIYEYQIN
jgi:predicted transcriptional regulator of viral defense system